ncbi:MAG: hypothetical protein ACJAR2_002760 [Ilumatobacter sp.]|jgi:hypothetical protein
MTPTAGTWPANEASQNAYSRALHVAPLNAGSWAPTTGQTFLDTAPEPRRVTQPSASGSASASSRRDSVDPVYGGSMKHVPEPGEYLSIDHTEKTTCL